MTTFQDELDIDLMIKGATMFKGNHNFKSYCYKPSENGIFKRLSHALIVENSDYRASFSKKRLIFSKSKEKRVWKKSK